jgi:hypothetical protein
MGGASTIQATTPTRLHNGQLFGDHKLLPLLLSSPRKNQKLPLVDKRGRLNVEIRGLPKTFLYWGDLFHTLVNMPNSRFIAILFCTYCLQFFGFAIPYYYDAYNNSCIPGVVSFDHAFWFRFKSSLTSVSIQLQFNLHLGVQSLWVLNTENPFLQMQ